MSWWLAWLVWLTFGGFAIDEMFRNISLGPPITIVVLSGYPVFLIAFCRTWRTTWFLPLAFAVLHLWYLTICFGVGEASEIAPHVSDSLLIIILLVCFAVPILCAVLVNRGKESLPRKTFVTTLSALFFILTLLASPVALVGMSISALEFVQANAFRDFCKSSVTGMSYEQIRGRITSSTPGRFLKEHGNELEISSHGRGCILMFDEGRATVKRLLPQSGFWWMLQGRPNAHLEGAFERGFPGLPSSD